MLAVKFHFSQRFSSLAMSSSPFPEDNEQYDTEIVTLTDEAERSLECYVDHSLIIEESTYILLQPIDSPISIIAWDKGEDASEATLLENEAEIGEIFPDAKAVLAEQNLTLKHTAYTLTVAGELPPVDEGEILALEVEESGSDLEPEEFQFLASFFNQEEEYTIYTPLVPLLFFARETQTDQLELLSAEEYKKVQPLLEDLLFNEVE